MESGAAKPKNWNVHWAVGIIAIDVSEERFLVVDRIEGT